MATRARSRKSIKACIDVALPTELLFEASQRAIAENPANAPAIPRGSVPPGMDGPPPIALAALTGKLWKPGRVLRCRFLDGEATVKARVEPYAHEWEQYANIKFVFGEDPDAEIRISFKQAGSWSYLGTDALTIPKNQATMNFGWLKPSTAEDEYARVVLHEFGHALGCIHEHQNPSTDIPWDKDAVYKYYQGPPNNWNKATVDVNLFTRYSADITQFSEFDRESIMLYPVPEEFTIGDFAVGWNKGLSKQDREFIGSLYPFAPKVENGLQINAPAITASIGQVGEIDTYTFVVNHEEAYRIETEGQLDVVMQLFGPNDPTQLVAMDDDSGVRLNARIVTTLKSGTYTVRIRHFSAHRTGEYKLGVYTVAQG
jgi:hypothetical protein